MNQAYPPPVTCCTLLSLLPAVRVLVCHICTTEEPHTLTEWMRKGVRGCMGRRVQKHAWWRACMVLGGGGGGACMVEGVCGVGRRVQGRGEKERSSSTA